jgi:hypothetical protein
LPPQVHRSIALEPWLAAHSDSRSSWLKQSILTTCLTVTYSVFVLEIDCISY